MGRLSPSASARGTKEWRRSWLSSCRTQISSLCRNITLTRESTRIPIGLEPRMEPLLIHNRASACTALTLVFSAPNARLRNPATRAQRPAPGLMSHAYPLMRTLLMSES